MMKRLTEKHKRKISIALRGQPKSLQARQNMSRADKGRIAWNKGKQMSEEYRAICRATHGGNIPWNKGLTNETDIRIAHYSQTKVGRHHTEEAKLKIGEHSRKHPRRYWLGKHRSEETKAKISAIKKLQFANNPELLKRCLTFRRPNKIESTLIDIMDRNDLPFKYVGDGDFILGGKCPDFLNVNGKKQLIELFGAHWHPIFDIARRKEHFGQYGFQTLIIWEDELKVLPEADIVKRIRKFSLMKEAQK